MKKIIRWFARFLIVCHLIIAVPESVSAAGRNFPDVTPGSWYYDCVIEMTQAGILTGFPDGTFQPNRLITGSELVSIIARQVGVEQTSVASAHWAARYLAAGLEQGWYDYDELPPTGEKHDTPITRQVAVKILMNALLPNQVGQYNYNTETAKMKDFSDLDGRYYNTVLSACASGIVMGDETGRFRPKDGLSRAEVCALLQRAVKQVSFMPTPVPDPTPRPAVIADGVSTHGALQVLETQLCDQNGQPVILHGMSSHGLHWFGEFASYESVKNTANYGANLFRVAMYTGEGGYLSNPALKDTAFAAVDAAIQNDMYVILDWHILSDGNPMDHLTEAKKFFSDAAQRYRDNPAVLYEICNEPNGTVSWSKDIKPYAEQVIEAIRAAGSQGIILVGSSNWSQDLHLAAADPLTGGNLMYTLHFYAGTHGHELRDRIDQVMNQGLAVFVSEWGTSRADGSGGVFLDEAQIWLSFLAQRGVSWANWSLCDKDETSAALKPGTNAKGSWKQEDLSESGRFVFSQFSAP